MAKKVATQQQIKAARDGYTQAIGDTARLLKESPLNIDAIERALKFTKDPSDCYQYIIKYGQEQKTQVTVHDSILIAASAYINSHSLTTTTPRFLSLSLGTYIDFNKISSPTITSILNSSPALFLFNYDKLNAEGKSKLAATPKAAFEYAMYILEDRPFPAGEAAIATSANYSIEYAASVLNNKPFPAGEPAIATNADYSLFYARMLNKPFPAGEPAIATSALGSFTYADEVLHGPFPAGERVIAAYASYAFDYARMLNKPFPAGEPAIATNRYYSFKYAAEILRGPFPAGEAEIATLGYFAFEYATRVIKRRFPAGEHAIATDSDDPSYARRYDEKFGTTLSQK